MLEFDNVIKGLRKDRNMTQQELAERLGVTKSAVSAYELGTRMPPYPTLVKIAHLFGVTTDFLLGVDNGKYLDISELTEFEIDSLMMLYNGFRKNHANDPELYAKGAEIKKDIG